MPLLTRLNGEHEAALEHFLRQHAESSMFLRSNLTRVGIAYRDAEYHGEYYGLINEDSSVAGVLTHFWNGSLIVQSPDLETLSQITDFYRGLATRPISAILGPADQALRVIEQLSLSDREYSLNSCEGLYALELRTLSEIVLPENGSVCAACEVDGELLKAWIKGYEIEALGRNDTPELEVIIQTRFNRFTNGTDAWALCIDQQPVSFSAFNARLPDMVQVGPVWTPPSLRNRGYARILVAETLQRARKLGASKGILFTDNPAAAKAYEAIGFEKIGSYRLAILRDPMVLPC
jgi:GNAT superfamily N-acetyltransferase